MTQTDGCPLWVIRVAFVMSAICPVYPEHQTFLDSVGTSHLCQQLTSGFSIAQIVCYDSGPISSSAEKILAS